MARGALRIYLGAAPGVGKTVAMLEEGHRRLARGTDVVVVDAETHGRPYTAQRLAGLPVVDGVAAALAKQPQVALVDDLARLWREVDALLDAGVDVIGTLNVQHLVSLTDVVEQITGVPELDKVPDAFVRAADQLELVDMAPEALRRRMAHGNIYPPERVDAALGNYFRIGNLTALRELALLWLADQVDEGLRRYRAEHGITGTWETKERVVVALTGGPEGETLIRRAARIASRTAGGELLAVHVARSDGLSGPGVAALTAQRLLVESLGGSYHSIVGDAVPAALLDFARRVTATQIVLGTSRRHWLAAALTGPGTGATVTRLSGSIDVHLVTHDYSGTGGIRLPRLTGGLTWSRRFAGLVLAAVLLPSLTAIGTVARHGLGFAADVPLFLLVVVLTSLVGGFYPALLSAIAAGLLLNYYFVPPLHTLSIAQPSNIVAVAIFLLIAVLVSHVVDLAARRSVQAARAGAEAETLSTFAGSLLRGEQTLPAMLDRVRETFAMDAAALLRQDPDKQWTTVEAAGSTPPGSPGKADVAVSIGDGLELALRGHSLPAAEHRVLAAFAAHVAVAYRQEQLAAAARAAEPLAESDRQRTALLNAVGHDLRTPIAAAKAAVSSLRASEVAWTPVDRSELLGTAEDALDRLTDLVTNLLDLSRLQAGVLPVVPSVVAVEDVVARALDHVDPDAKVEVDVPPDLPEVRADAGLLERVVANVVQNALRYTAAGTSVRVAGSALRERVELRVIDRGPGIDPAAAEAVFRPFQRTADASADGAGVGLGLAIARGFAEAMGGSVAAEPTPGGGATVVITLQGA